MASWKSVLWGCQSQIPVDKNSQTQEAERTRFPESGTGWVRRILRLQTRDTMIKRHPKTEMRVLGIEQLLAKSNGWREICFWSNPVSRRMLGGNHSRNKIQMPEFHSHYSNFSYVNWGLAFGFTSRLSHCTTSVRNDWPRGQMDGGTWGKLGEADRPCASEGGNLGCQTTDLSWPTWRVYLRHWEGVGRKKQELS